MEFKIIVQITGTLEQLGDEYVVADTKHSVLNHNIVCAFS